MAMEESICSNKGAIIKKCLAGTSLGKKLGAGFKACRASGTSGPRYPALTSIFNNCPSSVDLSQTLATRDKGKVVTVG